MKKYIAFLCFMAVCQAGYAQHIDRLFDEFSHQHEVNRITMGPLLMKLGSFFTETMGVSSIEVLELDACGESLKERFDTALKKLKDPRYETMVTNNQDGERTKILVRIDKEMIRELVVLTSGKSNVMVRLKGKIKPEDIEKVTRMHKTHKKDGC